MLFVCLAWAWRQVHSARRSWVGLDFRGIRGGGGEGAVLGLFAVVWRVFAMVGRKRVSVVRLTSRSSARLRGLYLWGGERRVGVLWLGGLWVVFLFCMSTGWLSGPGVMFAGWSIGVVGTFVLQGS